MIEAPAIGPLGWRLQRLFTRRDLAPWSALILKLGSVEQETDDEEERFSEEQIIGILKEQQAGLPVAEICRRHGISDATFYTWRSRYGCRPGRRRSWSI